MRAVAPTNASNYNVGRTWMVGDKSQDTVAVLACGFTPVGATWGFGSEAELRDAGASQIVRFPREL